MKWNLAVQKYFGLFFSAGIAGGFFFPEFFLPLSNYVLFILGFVMTLSFFTVDLKLIKENAKKIHIHLIIYIALKVLLPCLLYSLIALFNQTLALAVLLLTATSVAVVVPALSRLVHADSDFILFQVVLSSLFAPFQLPFLLKIMAGAVVPIDTLGMMSMLVKIIVVPFLIALLVKKFGPNLIEETKSKYGAYSVLLITALLLGLVAQGAPSIKANLSGAVPVVIETYVLGFILMAFGFYPFFFLEKRKRVALALGNLFMNVGLSIVLAAQFFSTEVLIICIIYELPANTLPVLIQRLNRPKVLSSEGDSSGKGTG